MRKLIDRFTIRQILAREILDSRGNPTVEVDVFTNSSVGRAAAPSGASTGSFEAHELRDDDPKRYLGRGVRKVIRNVNEVISPVLLGMDCRDQLDIDAKMIELDGSERKTRIGANGIVAVSIAVAQVAAASSEIPLFQYFGGIDVRRLPLPLMNIINGGKHAGNDLSIQEFMILPIGTKNFAEGVQWGSEIYHHLGDLIHRKYGKGSIGLGDEGGYSPPLKSSEEALDLVTKSVEELGLEPGRDIALALDVAASSFYQSPMGNYQIDGRRLGRGELLDFYSELVAKYPIQSIEDPFQEEDFEAHALLTKRLGGKVQIVGDDLFVTNVDRLSKGIRLQAANALLLKLNQIGTISEARKAAKMATINAYRVVVSHRSGETEDTTISDLAVGIGAEMIKCGAPARGERTAKYNQLLRIEEKLGSRAEYWGKYF